MCYDTIQVKATGQNVPVVLFTMCSTFEPDNFTTFEPDKILKCGNSNEGY